MRKTALLLMATWISVNAGLFNPSTEVSFCINPLFPADQKIYYPDQFNVNNGMIVPVERMVTIKDNVNWMPGYTIEGKIGKLSAFGLDLKFENYFNSYVNTFYNSYDGQNDSYPVDLKIFEISAGIFATLQINDKICIEPNLNFLYVSHQEYLSLSKIDYNYYEINDFLINT